jgi:hypothetical protein
MLLPVLSPAYDTDSKQTRDRAQTLLRNCNAAGGRRPRRLKWFQGAGRGLRPQAMPMAMLMPFDGGASAAAVAAAGPTGSCWCPDFSLDAGATVPVELTGAVAPTVLPVLVNVV